MTAVGVWGMTVRIEGKDYPPTEARNAGPRLAAFLYHVPKQGWLVIRVKDTGELDHGTWFDGRDGKRRAYERLEVLAPGKEA